MNDPTRARSRSQQIGWAAIALLLAFLHLFRNGSGIVTRELWLDEATTYGIAAQSWRANLTLPTTYNAQPPLYYLTLHGLLRVNAEQWFIRGFSWACVLGLLAFILFGVVELDPLARVALCASLVFHDAIHYVSQELRPYALAVLLCFVATIVFVRLVRSPERPTAVVYAIAALLALYTLSFDVWVITFHGVTLVVATAWQSRAGWRAGLRRQAPALAAMAIVAALYVPYVLYVWSWQGAIGHASLDESLQYVAKLSLQHEILYFLDIRRPWLAAWGTVAALLFGIYAELRMRRPIVLMLVAIVIGQVVLVHAFLHGRSFVTERYYSPAVSIFWLVAALGLQHAMPRPPKVVWVLVVSGLLYGASTMAPTFVERMERPAPRGVWRHLYDTMAAIPGRKVVFFEFGFPGTTLEYEARDDRDLVFRMKRPRFWIPESFARLDAATLLRWIGEESSADCFFYFARLWPGSPYWSVLVPAMARLGYAEIPLYGMLHGFCRAPAASRAAPTTAAGASP